MEIHAVNQEVCRQTEEGTIITGQEREIVFKDLTESEYQRITRIGESILRNAGIFDPMLGEYVQTDPIFEENQEQNQMREPTIKMPEQVLWTEKEVELLQKLLTNRTADVVQRYQQEFGKSRRSEASIRRKLSRLRKTVKQKSEHRKRQESKIRGVFRSKKRYLPGTQVKIIDPDINRLFTDLTKDVEHDETYPVVLNTSKDVAIIGYPSNSIRVQTSQNKIAPIEG